MINKITDNTIPQGTVEKWIDLYSRDVWPMSVWEDLAISALFILPWAYFFCWTLYIISPFRRPMVDKKGGALITHFGAHFLTTWLLASLAHAAIFGPGVIGCHLQEYLGRSDFSALSDITLRYMTLLGFIFGGF